MPTSNKTSPAPAASTGAKTRNVVLHADTAPEAGAPTPPKGFKDPGNSRRGGAAPTKQQQRDIGDVANELSAPAYANDFGQRAPDAATLIEALRRAKAWTDERDAAAHWSTYVLAQYNAAWGDVDVLMKKLAGPFRIAAEDDATVVKRYSQTNAFLNVRRVAGVKAAETKRQKKKKQEGK